MNRRRLLAALAAVTAGCAGREATGTPTRTPSGLAAQGVPTTICSEPVAADPGIHAVVEPAFAPDWTAHEIPDRYAPATGAVGGIDPEQTVVGLRDGDRARAYPLELLAEHEAVCDRFGGPVLVSFCPICRSGVVADRRIDGRASTFLVTGLLWRPERIQVAAAQRDGRAFGAERTGGRQVDVRASGNLVLLDTTTQSYWSQLLATGICGPETGTRLSIRPSTLSTWGAWRTANPDGEVLLPPPHSGVAETDRYAGVTPAAPPE
ncbi:DUF3179 domain-containing (seleno)protein [Halobaculum sp. MBLA0143]|uniref:DUF3179 domain-containing (seleno)protein n=1 Tax=Halobaculum sp. MBLA0143 TaxID=3079933 RepID=UPI0035264A4E